MYAIIQNKYMIHNRTLISSFYVLLNRFGLLCCIFLVYDNSLLDLIYQGNVNLSKK